MPRSERYRYALHIFKNRDSHGESIGRVVLEVNESKLGIYDNERFLTQDGKRVSFKDRNKTKNFLRAMVDLNSPCLRGYGMCP